jgi:hypothetical protein
MDAEAIRQELISYIHDNFIHNAEVRQSGLVHYMRSLDPAIREDSVVSIIREMADNGQFGIERNDDGETIIKLPTAR